MCKPEDILVATFSDRSEPAAHRLGHGYLIVMNVIETNEETNIIDEYLALAVTSL